MSWRRRIDNSSDYHHITDFQHNIGDRDVLTVRISSERSRTAQHAHRLLVRKFTGFSGGLADSQDIWINKEGWTTAWAKLGLEASEAVTEDYGDRQQTTTVHRSTNGALSFTYQDTDIQKETTLIIPPELEARFITEMKRHGLKFLGDYGLSKPPLADLPTVLFRPRHVSLSV